jgi:Ni,Fe-hydrogenase III large subunit
MPEEIKECEIYGFEVHNDIKKIASRKNYNF